MLEAWSWVTESHNNFLVRRQLLEVIWLNHHSNESLFRALFSYMLSVIEDWDSSLSNQSSTGPLLLWQKAERLSYSTLDFASWSTLICKAPSPTPGNWRKMKHLRTSQSLSVEYSPCALLLPGPSGYCFWYLLEAMLLLRLGSQLHC